MRFRFKLSKYPGILFVNNVLPIFSTNQVEWIKVPNDTAFPHQNHSKEERKDLDERHSAVTPSEAHRFNPLIDIKRYR